MFNKKKAQQKFEMGTKETKAVEPKKKNKIVNIVRNVFIAGFAFIIFGGILTIMNDDEPTEAEQAQIDEESAAEAKEYDRLDKAFGEWNAEKVEVVGNVKVDRDNQVVEIRFQDEVKLLNENELQRAVDLTGQNAYSVLGDNPNEVHLRFMTLDGKTIAEESIIDRGHGVFKLK